MPVSTEEQNLDLQKDAWTESGCECVFVDKVSGASIKRPSLTRAGAAALLNVDVKTLRRALQRC